MRRFAALIVCLCALWTPVRAAHGAEVRVMAASSLTDALAECARQYAAETGDAAPVLAFAGSSRLAQQLEAGARADVVITADAAWMDAIEEAGHLTPGSRANLLSTALAIVVPASATWRPSSPEDLASPALRHLAVAGEVVPAGRRAREALSAHGVLDPLQGRLVVTSNVRSALALAARGEVDAAVVYSSDALATTSVHVVHVFAAEDHRPILYPVALTVGGDRPEARRFADWLARPTSTAIFAAAGFHPLAGEAPPVRPPRPAWLGQLAVDQGRWSPLWLSLWVATLSLILSLLPAIGAGWLLARHEFPGKTVLSVAVMIPLVLPPVATGFLLLQLFGRHGVLAPVLDTLGLEVAFGRWGAVVAAAVVGFPLLVQLVRQAFESVDPRFEQVAQTLGKHPATAFATVTLPMALPGIVAGAVLAFARGLGEFGATAVLAGDVPGETRTIALALFAAYEQPGQEAAAQQLMWLSIGLCAVALVGYEALSRAQKRRLELHG